MTSFSFLGELIL